MAGLINPLLGGLNLPTLNLPPLLPAPTPTSSSSFRSSSTLLTTTSSTRPAVLTTTTSSAPRPTSSAPADSRIPVPGINGTADAATYRPICHASQGVHILAGSGANQPMYNGYGLLSLTMDGLLQAFPGSTNFSVPYNKTSAPGFAGQGIAAGVVAMSANIDWYTKGCPDTPIVVVGYSQGGIVSMNTFCGQSVNPQLQTDPISTSYLPNIIKVILYGEETYRPNWPFNTGTCTTGQGTVPRFNTSRCYPYANKFASYCDQFDGGCCKNASEPTFPAVHLGYAQKYYNATIDEVRNAYNAYKSGTA